jgi:three-Cys-motif partner protein
MSSDRICGNTCRDSIGNCKVIGEDGYLVQCVGQWVEDKYSFLERYIDATRYVRKKFSDKNNAVFIDLFAGPGRCVIKNEKREIKNGALRVLTNQAVPFSEWYFFDIDRQNTEAMSHRIGDKNNCSVRCCDSNKEAVELVATLHTKPYRYHFVYMDPFGPEGLPFKTVMEFAKLDRVDLFIHFPIGAIRRNLPIWREGDYGILDEFLGTSEWRDNIENLRQGRTLPALLNLYEKQLLNVGFPAEGLKMAGSDETIFTSLPVVSVKNTREVELYALVLASKHGIAQKIWNSVIMVDPHGQGRFL